MKVTKQQVDEATCFKMDAGSEWHTVNWLQNDSISSLMPRTRTQCQHLLLIFYPILILGLC